MLKNSSYAKKLTSITIISFFTLTTLIWLNGCQKKKVGQEELSDEQRIELTKKWISKQKKTSFTIQDGKTIESYYSDRNGNRVTKSQLLGMRTGPGCYGDEPTPISEFIRFDENCASGGVLFDGLISFKVSAYNEIVPTNPANPGSAANADKTRGRLQILNSSGTQIFNQANIWSNLVITDLGEDFSRPIIDGRYPKNYRVTFQVSNISSSVIYSPNYQARVYLTFFSECEEDTNPYPYNTIAAYGNASGLTACNIINKVYINPQLRSVSGVATCCCIPFLYSNRQEVEIYASNAIIGVTAPLWKAVFVSGSSSPSPLNATETRIIPTSGTPGNFVATGQTVKIRYRNLMLNTSTNPASATCYSSWLAIPETYVW
ncbi:MAG: hypothetical protein U0T11_03325 [Chitinophagaceae bacterium]